MIEATSAPMTYRLVASADGRVSFDDLPAGAFRMEVERTGYLPLSDSRLVVRPGELIDLVLELDLAPFLHEEILVGSRSGRLLADDPESPVEFSRDEVEAIPHLGGDAFRALTFLPGMQTADGSARFGVHGGRPDETMISLDGQELYDAFHLQDFDNGLSIVPTQNLDGIQHSTGTFGAWRGDRMSSVLDLVTRVPSERFQRIGLSLLTVDYATGGTVGEDGAWMASARRGSIELASRIFGRENPSFWDAFAKGQSQIGDRHLVVGRVLFAEDQLGFSEVIDDLAKRFDTDYRSTYLWGSHDAAVGGHHLLQSTVSVSRSERDRNGREVDDDIEFFVADKRSFDTYQLRHDWSFQGDRRHGFGAGVELRRYDVDYDYSNRVDPPIVPDSPYYEPRGTTQAFASNLRGDHLGLWASERVALFGRDAERPARLEIGGRYDRHPLTGDTLFSPRINLAWQVSRGGAFHMGWGKYYQTQRPYELMLQDGETRLARAEGARRSVIGFEQSFQGGRETSLSRRAARRVSGWRLDLHHSDISDPRDRYENLYEPIDTFPEIEPDRVAIRPEQARTWGADLMVRGGMGARTTWFLSYAYSRAEDRLRLFEDQSSDLGQEWIRRHRDQPHALNFNVSRWLPANWRLDVAFRYHTGWTTTPITLSPDFDSEGGDEDEEGFLVVGRLNSDRVPDNHRMDLRLSREWQLRRGSVRFYFDVQNVYDRKNVAGFDLSVEDGVLEKEAERFVGVFPSLGVSFEF
jgi:hypothetical protein